MEAGAACEAPASEKLSTYSFDCRAMAGEYCVSGVQEHSVKQARWVLTFCLVGMVLLLAVPSIDMPETAFNEMDTPLVAHVTLPRIWLATPSMAASPVIDLVFQRIAIDGTPKEQFEPITKSYPISSLQPLLCTFLI